MHAKIEELHQLVTKNRFTSSWICGQGMYVYDQSKLIVNVSRDSTPVPLDETQCWDFDFLLDKTLGKIKEVLASREAKALS